MSIYSKVVCPFCGYHSTQVLGPTTQPNTSSHGKGFQIECLNCGSRGPSGMATPYDAGRAWDHGDSGFRDTGYTLEERLNQATEPLRKVGDPEPYSEVLHPNPDKNT